MPEHYGVLAIGRSGRFTVEILEARAGARLMSIEADGWSLTFALNEHRLADILTHLRGGGQSAKLQAGIFLGAPVILIRDNEFSDRYFLRAYKEGHLLEFVLAAEQLAQFTAAVAQACHDLAS